MNEVTATKTEGATALKQALDDRLRTPAPVVRPQPRSEVKKPNESEVMMAVEDLNNLAASHQINLNFSVDKDTGRTVIRVVNRDTNEVVRQFPPEEILELAANLDDLAGHLINAKA